MTRVISCGAHLRSLSLAVVVGTLAALVILLAGSRTPDAWAANHCTRYAPTISQDANCNVSGAMPGSFEFLTSSVALRDSAQIFLYNSRSYQVGYYGSTISVSGTGFGNSVGASDGYRYADCWINSSATGFCETNWHD